MRTRLTKEEDAFIKKCSADKVVGPIYSEDGQRLLTVLGNPQHVEVKEGVKCICNGAFKKCDNLQEVVLPASVEELGNSAFKDLKDLTKVTMPGVVYIGPYCFEHCENLKDIVLPETLKAIEGDAFSYTYALEQINIPSNLENIDKYAFMHSGLKSLHMEISNKCYICEKAFSYNEKLECVYLNKNVRICDKMAFANCTALKSIELEKPRVTCMGGIETMLLGCTALEKIVLPKNKYNSYPNFNIQHSDNETVLGARDFNSLITPKEESDI